MELDVKRSDHLRNLQLADTFPRDAASVDLLVGADQFYKLVQGDVRKGRPGRDDSHAHCDEDREF